MRRLSLFVILFGILFAPGCGPKCPKTGSALEVAACEQGLEPTREAPKYFSTGLVDWSQAETLAMAAVLAYEKNLPHCPATPTVQLDGYTVVDCWSGLGWPGSTMEGFGYVFRRNDILSGESGPRYLFAFRGTASARDAVADLYSLKTTTWPYGGSVGEGFFWAYAGNASDTNPKGLPAKDCTAPDQHAQPMRSQLLCLIDKYRRDSAYPIGGIEITGHSLGSALGTLFAADLANQEGYSDLLRFNKNFASPRVGNRTWAKSYHGLPVASNTLRFANQYDLVPCVPPVDVFDFVHVGTPVALAFHEADWELLFQLGKFAECLVDNPIDKCLSIGGVEDLIEIDHSSTNYHAVVYCTLKAPSNVCKHSDWKNPSGPEKTVGTIDVEKPGSFDICSYL